MTPPSLRTIGYEASTFGLVRDTLAAAGVRLLVDVRALAGSRKPGFSKRQLAAGLAEVGIGYVHLQPLGTPKPGRDAVRRGDVATMHRLFLEHMTADRPQSALTEAVTLVRSTPSCLLCFERDHRTCHRTLVAEMVAAETGQAIVHLETPELFGS
ncbi:MAG TPA: DUF488 domain-containing protein [Acetobacteraceae bacterium]